MIDKGEITGLVLAGGRGSRMGGLDKGLLPYRGTPLARHALDRLRPQVGRVMVNANRHESAYAAMGVPVLGDAVAGFPGPLAGFLAGLTHGDTEWLATVPCDCPLFPLDLVARLAAGLGDAKLAVAVTRGADGAARVQPVFCLVHRSLQPNLALAVAAGQAKVERWIAEQDAVRVAFDDDRAFANANTAAELQALEQHV